MRLAEASAWWWAQRTGGELNERFRREQISGQIATSAMVNLELLHGSRNAADFRDRREGLVISPTALTERRSGREPSTSTRRSRNGRRSSAFGQAS